MFSSIFNSNKKILLSVTVLCIMLFAYYFSVVFLYKNTNLNIEGAAQWNNIIKTQEYVYDKKDVDVVLVGSSLTYLFPNDKLPEKWFNMGISGKGPITGLKIVIEDKKNPNVVLIEAGPTILAGLDNNVINKTFNDFIYFFPFLNVKYRPDTILNTGLLFFQEEILNKKRFRERSVTKKELEIAQKAYDGTPDKIKLNLLLDEMDVMISVLKNKNIKVMFFYPPIEKTLESRLYYTEVRKAFLLKFPKEEYHWIDNDVLNEYKTFDSQHLTKESAGLYIEYLHFEVYEKTKNIKN